MPGTISGTSPSVLVPGGSMTVSGTGFGSNPSVYVYSQGAYSKATVTTPSPTDTVFTVPTDLTVGSTGNLLVVNSGEFVGARSSDLAIVASATTPTTLGPGMYVRSSNLTRPQVTKLNYPVGLVTTTPSGGNVTVSFFANAGPQVVSSVPTSELKLLSGTELNYLDGRFVNVSKQSSTTGALSGRVGSSLVSSRSSAGLPANPVRIQWGYDGGGVAISATLRTSAGSVIAGATIKWVSAGRVIATSTTSGAGVAFCTLRAGPTSPTLLTNLPVGDHMVTPIFDGDASNSAAYGQPFSVRIQGVYTAATLVCTDVNGTPIANESFMSQNALVVTTVTVTPNRIGPSPNNRFLFNILVDDDPFKVLDMGPLGPNFRMVFRCTPAGLGVAAGLPFSIQGIIKNGPLTTDTNSPGALYVSESIPSPGSLVTGETNILRIEVTA